MKKKSILSSIVPFAAMLVLILDGKTALAGGIQGLSICLETVIPSLFPFFILSIFITGRISGKDLPALAPLGRLCGIPSGTESVLLVGFLGGYPVGAQAVGNLWRTGALSQKAAQRMLGFCSNAGPGFLFGMSASLFSKSWMAWCLWGIHILSAIAAAVFMPAIPQEAVKISPKDPIRLTEALNQAIRVMASVCGWIVLFRVLISFGDRWLFWMLPEPYQIAMIGILELSNGCCALKSLSSESLRFILCSGILAFGGCCVTMQTMSVTSGLSMKYYCFGKMIQTLLSLLLAWSVVQGSWHIWFALLLAAISILRKKQISSSIFMPVGV